MALCFIRHKIIPYSPPTKTAISQNCYIPLLFLSRSQNLSPSPLYPLPSPGDGTDVMYSDWRKGVCANLPSP